MTRLIPARSRVLLLIPHLREGGAARITAILAEGLSPDKFEVHLGVVTGGFAPGSLSEHAAIHVLGARRVREGLRAVLRLVWRIRPHVILSGMAHLNLGVLMMRPLLPRGTRIVVRQNGEPGDRDAGWLTPLLYRLLYRRAEAVICQTHHMAEAMAKAMGTTANLHVLPNPVNVRPQSSGHGSRSGLWSGPGPHLLAIGRLSPEKGFDLLVKAMALLREKFPSADLVILGAGHQEDSLRRLAQELAVEDCVHFAGQVAEPKAWFPGASLFVLPSRREGLPNALLEAAAAGLPIAATPARGGLSELLADKEGVWLAHDVSPESLGHSLEASLCALLPGQRFPHLWIDEFRAERAVPRYEALIDAVLAGAVRSARRTSTQAFSHQESGGQD